MAFSPKTPTEIVRYGFNFGALIQHGESVATSTWTIVTSGASPVSASSMLFGSPIVDLSPVVRHLVQGGQNGTTYVVGCRITTSEGQILETATTLGVSQ
jgi:hypothetical protein